MCTLPRYSPQCFGETNFTILLLDTHSHDILKILYYYTNDFLYFPPLCLYRQTGIGVSSMFARMGGVLAPIINMLHNHSPTIPLVIFGTSPLLGALLALALPETADRPLPDTVEDVENWDLRYYSVTSVFTRLGCCCFFCIFRLELYVQSKNISCSLCSYLHCLCQTDMNSF